GKNYAYLGLPAHFLIFDEYVAFMEMLGTKENTAVMNKLKQIVMLGRQEYTVLNLYEARLQSVSV
ncbi:Ftsk/spoiiie family protein, partial [human gut metagenome]